MVIHVYVQSWNLIGLTFMYAEIVHCYKINYEILFR